MAAVVRVAVAIILFYALVQVDDVSAQCVISPNLDSLTIADGLTRDVEFHCQCMDGNARWLFSNGSLAPTQNFNIPPAILLLPGPFNDDDDAGTYTCSPNNMLNDPSRDTITLSAGSPTDPVRICRIYSPSVTTNDEMIDIPSGTQNVTLYCKCTRDTNVTVGPATWYINGTQVTRTQASGNNPYSRDNVPAPLIIPSFTADRVGRYSCDSFGDGRVTIDLTLSLPGEPQSLETVSVNSSSVTLQWSPPVTPNGIITQYSLQCNTTAVANTTNDVLVYTVSGLSSETVYVLQVRAYTGAGAGLPSIITIITSPRPVSDVTVRNESVTSSTLTLTWMEISLTNSDFSHYTVFYLPVRGPYDPIMASNRRKRQSTQAGELTMNFTGTTGTLTDLYGAVTYRIQVAVVATLNGQTLNGQEIIGDRSDAVQVTTLEEITSDDGSDDNNGVVTALAILFVIAVIGLVISVLIIVFLVVKLKQSRYDVNQSNIRYSDVKQSRDNTITDPTNKYIKPSEPEYEGVDTKRNMKPGSDVKMDVDPAYGCDIDVKMDVDPAYQVTR